ncbi:hypothetical protein [Devosia lacusdianchii]|uniref:hypothetical protein n=1 Tax=Devosia lacusdianchii TaxID=2917991 RepID=UPI001F0563C6|nr:hypothetical protein [Devosia sp. JXJ CY 41]
MTQMIDRLPATDDLVAIAERASLYQLLQSALRRQRRGQELPSRLYRDVGLPPSQWPDFTPRCR